MRRRVLRYGLTAAAFAASRMDVHIASLARSAVALAPDAARTPGSPMPTPKLADGHPDLSGRWGGGGGGGGNAATTLRREGQLPQPPQRSEGQPGQPGARFGPLGQRFIENLPQSSRNTGTRWTTST